MVLLQDSVLENRLQEYSEVVAILLSQAPYFAKKAVRLLGAAGGRMAARRLIGLANRIHIMISLYRYAKPLTE